MRLAQADEIARWQEQVATLGYVPVACAHEKAPLSRLRCSAGHAIAFVGGACHACRDYEAAHAENERLDTARAETKWKD